MIFMTIKEHKFWAGERERERERETRHQPLPPRFLEKI
jgi:hypothetical protein